MGKEATRLCSFSSYAGYVYVCSRIQLIQLCRTYTQSLWCDAAMLLQARESYSVSLSV